METSCIDCIFRQNDEYNRQNGCKLKRLEKFVERKEATFNSNHGCFVINRLCNMCCNKERATTFENPLEALEKEAAIDYAVIVVNRQTDNINLFDDDLENTLHSIFRQKYKPERVIIATTNPNIDRYNKINLIKHLFKDTGIQYYISHITDPLFTYEEVIDTVFNKVNNMYYTIIDNGRMLTPSFSQKLNYLLNEKLEKNVLIRGNEDTNYTVLSALHYMLSGNKDRPLVDKILELAKKDSEGVLTWEQFQNTLSAQ